MSRNAINPIQIPWGAWYHKPESLILNFPSAWKIQSFTTKNATSIQYNHDIIKNALTNPVESPPLSEIAKGKQSVVIVIEDISRPSKLDTILNVIFDELEKARITKEQITIIGAIGAHRPMNREDYIKKLSKEIWYSVNIENHHPYENLTYLGESNTGTPIYVNRTYYEADLKIAIGTVIPHPLAGFGGGAKLILPGISGIETLLGNHQAGVRGIGIGLGIITELRKDIEDVCKRAGLDFSINLVSNPNREISGIFAGDYIQAHRQAVAFAKEVYSFPLPKLKKENQSDIAFFNLYPEDLEFTQSIKWINLFLLCSSLLKRNAPCVIMTACPEGRGFHSLSGETGSKMFQNWSENPVVGPLLAKRKILVFSPNLSKYDIYHSYSKETLLFHEFTELINSIQGELPQNAKAALFPNSLSLPVKE
jgi:nickel-dependent lactate racemase